MYLLVCARRAVKSQNGAEGELRRALCVLGKDGRLRLAGVGRGEGLGFLTSHCVVNGRVVVFDDVSYSVWSEARGELCESPLRKFSDIPPSRGN